MKILKNKIVCADCLNYLKAMQENNIKVDNIITSPPYNTSTKGKKATERYLHNNDVRYKNYLDTKTSDEYLMWLVDIFNNIEPVLKDKGAILWNMSYTTNYRNDTESFWKFPYVIMNNTNFKFSDLLVWKKNNAMPANSSPNKLGRLCEFIFIIVKKEHYKDFHANHKLSKVTKVGNRYFSPMNFISAANNDGVCKINRATFSSELVNKLIDMYVPDNGSVYDPFSGTGTTVACCAERGITGYGSEIDKEQTEYANKRIENRINGIGLFK